MLVFSFSNSAFAIKYRAKLRKIAEILTFFHAFF